MLTFRPYSVICALAALFIFSACSTSRQGATTVVPGGADPTVLHPVDTLMSAHQPEEIPPPADNELEYFKIQVLAAGSFSTADAEKQKLQQYTMKNIFLVQEGNLWKVQVGDYLTRESAEKEKTMLTQLGWSDAWLIQFRKTESSLVQQQEPVKEEAPIEIFTRDAKPPVEAAELVKTELVYAVQVIATRNKTEAENLQKNLRMMDLKDINLVNEDNFWKIRVGRNTDYQQARVLLNKIREMGFYDSWITRIKVPVVSAERVVESPKTVLQLYVEILSTTDEIVAMNEVRKIYLLTETEAFTRKSGTEWSVQTGPYSSVLDAENFLSRVKDLGYRSSRIITK